MPENTGVGSRHHQHVIAMPGMDGLEATSLIKKQNSEMKILILTQYDNKKYILSTIQAGASGYLPKRALGTDLFWLLTFDKLSMGYRVEELTVGVRQKQSGHEFIHKG